MFKHFNIKYSDYNQVNEWFKEGLIEKTYVFPDVIDILKLLKDDSFNLFILTNGLISLQKTRIVNSELMEYIDKIYVSQEIGYSKPNIKSFEYVLKDNNLTKDEVVMIGDSLTNDIYGANNYGVKSIWCNYNTQTNHTNIFPTLEINDFKTLSTIFKKEEE